MPSSLKDPSAKLVKSYLPPFKGTWKTLPPYLLSDDTLQESLNVTLQGGKLRSRCGLASYDTTNLGNKVLGSFLTVDTLRNKYPIVSTRNKVFRYIGGVFQDCTSVVALTNTAENQVRMSSLQLGTNVYILYANGVDTLKVISQSGYLLAEISPFAGSIPVCTDVCTSFSRFIGITPPYTLQWSDVINDSYLSFRNWPALNQVILADTEDSLVAVRSLGTLGIAVYKEGNIFVGIAQGGPNSQAFRFEHRGEYEGPAGVNAIVNVNGAHIYFTSTGRVGLFDGTQHTFLCDGLWPFLQEDVDTTYASSIFGVYNYRTAEVTFWYPKYGEAGLLRGMLVINIPFPLAGVTTYAYFLGETNFSCTNGLSVRLFNAFTSPLVFGNTNETFILQLSSYTDKNSSFPCSFEPGIFRPPVEENEAPSSKNVSAVFQETVEIYASRGEGRGLVEVSGVTSDTLEGNGNFSTAQTIDLSTTPVDEYISFPETGSFLGVKFSWESTAQFEYKGADVYARKTG